MEAGFFIKIWTSRNGRAYNCIMIEELLQTKNNAISMIISSEDNNQLEEIRIEFLGRNGKLTNLLKLLPKLPRDERASVGKTANEVKIILENAIVNQNLKIKNQKREKEETKIDYTTPGIPPKIGHLHAITQAISETIDVFKSLGYQTADGPEIETDYYNFEALNIPKNHPSRDTQMTFYLEDNEIQTNTPGDVILRTQMSGMQARVMEKMTPPVRVIVPGKVYRYEQVDASHGFEFWQLEGFLVDRHIRLTDLFGTLDFILKKLLGENIELKFATTNFPFVEPGVDTYIKCAVCKGGGCSFCKMSGWSEIMPAGMIHPNVLKAVGFDPQEYNGFAFCIGFSRLVALKYQMTDLRILSNPDLRIINQF